MIFHHQVHQVLKYTEDIQQYPIHMVLSQLKIMIIYHIPFSDPFQYIASDPFQYIAEHSSPIW